MLTFPADCDGKTVPTLVYPSLTENETRYKVAFLDECIVNVQRKYEITLEQYSLINSDDGALISIIYPVIHSTEYQHIDEINQKLFLAAYRNEELLLKKPEDVLFMQLDIKCEVVYSDDYYISAVFYGLLEHYPVEGKLLHSCTINLTTGEYINSIGIEQLSEIQRALERMDYIVIHPFYVDSNDKMELDAYIADRFPIGNNGIGKSSINAYYERSFEDGSFSQSVLFLADNGIGIILTTYGAAGDYLILYFKDI